MLSEYLSQEIERRAAQARLPRHRLLYESLRAALKTGVLRAGDRLPSSRDLAEDLHLARNTVVTALGQLGAEGFVHSRVGSGTYVSDSLLATPRPRGPARSVAARTLSRRGQELVRRFPAHELEVQPFTPGPADFSSFPVPLWQRLQNRHWRMTYPEMLDYSDFGGHAPLRRAVADHLRLARSLVLDADQVLVTSGTQQSLGLCALLLADAQDTVWIEDPAYWGAAKAFLAAGLKLHPVAVDAQGMAGAIPGHRPAPRMIYLTPSHQYPTGVVTSLARRHQLLAIAAQHKAWVLEDDYDSEFRFDGAPISSLAGMDTDDRVLYMGSFSKVLYPGLKLGYLVVPRAWVGAFRRAHYDLNRPGQMPLQAALAEFMAMGHFTTALRRARSAYAQRRAALLQALEPCLRAGAWISGAEQGLHLCLHLPGAADDAALGRRIGREGMTVRPLSAYCLDRRDLRGLVIGYGYARPEAILRHGPTLARLVTAALAEAPQRARS